jgi:hypothetical protein
MIPELCSAKLRSYANNSIISFNRQYTISLSPSFPVARLVVPRRPYMVPAVHCRHCCMLMQPQCTYQHAPSLRTCDATSFDIWDLKLHVSVKRLTVGLTFSRHSLLCFKQCSWREADETSGSPSTWRHSSEDWKLQHYNCLHFLHIIRDAFRILIMYLQAS